MQFIFGRNHSQYGMLYTDDTTENAVLGLIRLPFAPSEKFDIYGYMPFGANSNRPLYFRCKKDTAFNRNVYFLHGVYRELDTEYFFGTDYVGDMVTNFIPQSEFDSIRETPEKCTFRPTPNAKLVQAAEADAGKIDKDLLIAILATLYQKQNVVLVMDDEKFNTDDLRVVICYIFKFLTPSLRKICSYIIGMYDTESMDFMIRAIPRSMYRKDRTFCVDLSAKTCDPETNATYQNVAAKLYGTSAAVRKELFELFEILYYGRSSTYKKHRFTEYIDLIAQNTVTTYETLLQYYLKDDRFRDDMKIPERIAKAMAPLYRDENYLDSVINMAEFDKLDPRKFYQKELVAIRKLYLLADPQLTYLRKKITEIYSETICYDNAPALVKTFKQYTEARENEKTLPSEIETAYMMVLDACMADLKPRLQLYSNLANEAAIIKHLSKVIAIHQGKIIPDAHIPTICLEEYKAYTTPYEAELRSTNVDIKKAFELVAVAQFRKHNKETQAQIDEAKRKSAAEEEQFCESLILEELRQIKIPLESRNDKDAPTAQNLDYYNRLRALMENSNGCRNDEILQKRVIAAVRHILYASATDPEFFLHRDAILSLITSPDEIQRIAKNFITLKDLEDRWLCIPYLALYFPDDLKLITAVKNTCQRYSQWDPVTFPTKYYKATAYILNARGKNSQITITQETYAKCEAISKMIAQLGPQFNKLSKLILSYAAQLLPKPAAPERSGLFGNFKKS